MITITIDNQQFEIGPDSMQVENEEVFELIKNSSRVFDHSTITLGPYVLKPVSDGHTIKNFAFCLKDGVQRQTYIYGDHVIYQRKVCTIKHSKFQFQSDISPYYNGGTLVEFLDNVNWHILDATVVKGSYLTHSDIVIHAKMVRNRRSFNMVRPSSPNKRYELYKDEPILKRVLNDDIFDGLTKFQII